MSHIGKKVIPVPEQVEVMIDNHRLEVKGPKGNLMFAFDPSIAVVKKDGEIVCTVARPHPQAAALWGTTRAIIANLIQGVSQGFVKKLELRGVGYRAAVKGKNLELLVGFSHPVTIEAPAGISFKVEKEIVTVEGIDNQLVGQVAANIRLVRPPEPYKGKGIRYVGEYVKQKVGKVVGATST